VEEKEREIRDPHLDWSLGRLSDLIDRFCKLDDEVELARLVVDSVLPMLAGRGQQMMPIIHLIWLAFEFNRECYLMTECAPFFPWEEGRLLATYLGYTINGWASNGTPDKDFCKSSKYVYWHEKMSHDFVAVYCLAPERNKLGVIPLEAILSETNTCSLRHWEKVIREVEQEIKAYTTGEGVWEPCLGRPTCYEDVITYLWEGSKDETTSLICVRRLMVWFVSSEGRCKDGVLLTLAWMCLRVPKHSSLWVEMQQRATNDESALLLLRYVKLGIRGFARGGEPTWLLKTHPKVLAVVLSDNMASLRKIMWFDVLYDGIRLDLGVPVNKKRDLKKITFLI
jgi:hypothetical protein